MLDAPRLLEDFRPLTGALKADYTDFEVDEVPLYAPSGEGTHTYFLLEKAGLATPQAVSDIARALGVLRRDIGFAGQKDARAVTRQWLSVEHIEPERVRALELPRMRVLEVTRHRNKLKLGHLAGNRFCIKVRQTQTERLAEVQDALAVLEKRGVPNYFGEQRFGARGDSWLTGRAIVRSNFEEALQHLLGRTSPADHGDVRRARNLFDQGRYGPALRAWPAMFRDERRALKALIQTGKPKRAFLAIDPASRAFFVSAYQSHLFNRVLALRIRDGLDRLHVGDLAWIHVSGAVFKVVDPAVEQPRADAFEISPSGPLFGYRMTWPEGQPGEREHQVLAEEGLAPEDFRTNALRIKGMRRALRFRTSAAQVRLGADERGAYLEFRFTLPRGCYATVLLRELIEEQSPAGTDGDDDQPAEE